MYADETGQKVLVKDEKLNRIFWLPKGHLIKTPLPIVRTTPRAIHPTKQERFHVHTWLSSSCAPANHPSSLPKQTTLLFAQRSHEIQCPSPDRPSNPNFKQSDHHPPTFHPSTSCSSPVPTPSQQVFFPCPATPLAHFPLHPRSTSRLPPAHPKSSHVHETPPSTPFQLSRSRLQHAGSTHALSNRSKQRTATQTNSVFASENSGRSEVNCERSVIPENEDDRTCTEADAELNGLGVDGWRDPPSFVPLPPKLPFLCSSTLLLHKSRGAVRSAPQHLLSAPLHPSPSLLDLPPLSLLPLNLSLTTSASRPNQSQQTAPSEEAAQTVPPSLPQQSDANHPATTCPPTSHFQSPFRVRVFDVSIVLFPNLNSSISAPITTPFPFRLPLPAFLHDLQSLHRITPTHFIAKSVRSSEGEPIIQRPSA
ncbi:hypothetical protein BLNAU_15333 [Blattamonas nauphoetae]|uniref:Uncharacterized protein n=1 Tax=Blattamonas nauphoetae TaxID=2049346 RepID=A0ABQ9XDI8_9EUKA|nr:hypothetical protein BLNAU_15333 [Blattamonas nauphoetae]